MRWKSRVERESQGQFSIFYNTAGKLQMYSFACYVSCKVTGKYFGKIAKI